jgi:hypothetical protein
MSLIAALLLWQAGLPPASSFKADAFPAKPRTIRVAPTDVIYNRPSVAAALAGEGDTILVEPGRYQDCIVLTADRVTLKAARPGVIELTGPACEGKGMIVVKGRDTTIEDVSVRGVAVPDMNGVAIRAEGAGLTVRRLTVTDSQGGILINDDADSVVRVEDSRFERIGPPPPRWFHGIYANRIARLEVRRVTFRDMGIGHHVKSRARMTIVTDSIMDDSRAGRASYLVDLANGGSGDIRNNVMVKTQRSDNKRCTIRVGGEGPDNPFQSLVIANNRFTSDMLLPTVFVCNDAGYPITLVGNHLSGRVVPIQIPPDSPVPAAQRWRRQ